MVRVGREGGRRFCLRARFSNRWILRVKDSSSSGMLHSENAVWRSDGRTGKRDGSMFRDVEYYLRLNSRCANTTQTTAAAGDVGEIRRASSIRGRRGATHRSFPVAASDMRITDKRSDAIHCGGMGSVPHTIGRRWVTMDGQ